MDFIFVTLLIAAFAVPPGYSKCEGKTNGGCGSEKPSTRSLYGNIAWLNDAFDRGVLHNNQLETLEQLKKNVQFYLYNNRNRPSQAEVGTLDSQKLFYFFDPRLPTEIVIHGFQANFYSPSCQSIKNVNVICVDWRTSANAPYRLAKEATVNVAAIIAQFIDRLNKDYGNKNSQVHIIGHSLGAHIAGLSARLVKSGRIPIVTGLDPAQPLYDMNVVDQRLSTNDADFVEVIHTGGKRLGTQFPLGHVDVYVNGGDAVQRGCGNDISGGCSHSRAYEIYDEALRRPNSFIAFSCKDWDTFRNGKCLQNQRYSFGGNVDTRARGLYFCRTSDRPPYGLGDKYQAFSNSAILEDKKFQNWASKMYGWLL